MSSKRATILGAIFLASVALSPASAQGPLASERLNMAGAEQKMLEREAGTFDVVATLYPPGGGTPIVSRDLMAERLMIGPFLQETMQPKPESDTPPSRASTI